MLAGQEQSGPLRVDCTLDASVFADDETLESASHRRIVRNVRDRRLEGAPVAVELVGGDIGQVGRVRLDCATAPASQAPRQRSASADSTPSGPSRPSTPPRRNDTATSQKNTR
jgi:hypothetical protein